MPSGPAHPPKNSPLLALFLALALPLAACSGTPSDDDDSPGATPSATQSPLDQDGDGYSLEIDCDDSDDQVYPGADEACDSKDNDCDSGVDEGDPPGGATWYADVDKDGYGDLYQTTIACLMPAGYVNDATDCDDTNKAINPGATEVCDEAQTDEDCDGDADDADASVDPASQTAFYADGDGDGQGAEDATATQACHAQSGTANNNTDCDDTDANVYTGAPETCSDSVDKNCDGQVAYADTDGDGFPACEDCDDTNPALNPDATEVCDAAGVDEDCDGQEGDDDPSVDPASQSTWFHDVDTDGYGDTRDSQLACQNPTTSIDWWSDNSRDCDDRDDTVNPDATETCNGADDDCDGETDEGSGAGAQTWYHDEDSDSYGDPRDSRVACAQPDDYVSNADDCDDSRPSVNPDGTESCDGQDNDCDGQADEAKAVDATVWYADSDEDGYGATATGLPACVQPDGAVATPGDCDDNRASVNPGTAEVCDASNRDEDCDGLADDQDDSAQPATKTRYYVDADGDGYGDEDGAGALYCDQPDGYVLNDDDCADGNSAINPAAMESCSDSIDLNCDGSVGFTDKDDDGVAACEDCNDLNPAISPDATEVCDGANVDEDCDGLADDLDDSTDEGTKTAYYHDVDTDGFGDSSDSALFCDDPTSSVDWWSRVGTDCDDRDGDAFPGATETCNGVDDDCDSRIDEGGAADASLWYRDADEDGYGDELNTSRACRQPDGYVATGDDCDDANGAVNPAALELCDGSDQDCDDAIDEGQAVDAPEWYRDADGDTFGDAQTAQLACSQPAGFVPIKGDCNDSAPAINPTAAEICDPGNVDEDCDGLTDDNDPTVDTRTQTPIYSDNDGDGYGAGEATLYCDAPTGTAPTAGDCNDSDDAYNPGAEELCTTEVDLNCDGFVGFTDNDGDGYAACEDCDDNNSAINPDAQEVCDPGNVDEDCDGLADDRDPDVAAGSKATYYHDVDTDSFGDPNETRAACDDPSTSTDWWTVIAGDCNDRSANVNPNAAETCNERDDDCDSTVDEEALDPNTYYSDDDDDGFGDPAAPVEACSAPDGAVVSAGDCDDGDPGSNPEADERCDGADNNCDGEVDERGAVDGQTWYTDGDGDGYGQIGSAFLACDDPGEGTTAVGEDCNDADTLINPGANELCDTLDNDCDSDVDEEALNQTTWYRDDDQDSYGLTHDSQEACFEPDGYAALDGDCDDDDDDVHPGALEFCSDTEDLNCDGSTGQDDNDGDGFAACDDCNDNADDVYPGADEFCDGLDTDCDGIADESSALDASDWHIDLDDDGFGDIGDDGLLACDQPSGYVGNAQDCDDGLFYVYPGADEFCDDTDEDCDGTVDEGGLDGLPMWPDTDGDGHGDSDASPLLFCEAAPGYAPGHDDCNDDDASISPSAPEVCDNGRDDNCNGDFDCEDGGCAAEPTCLDAEACDNTFDDDEDLAVDCADSDCSADAACDGHACYDEDLGTALGTFTGTTTGQSNSYLARCGSSAASPDYTYRWVAPADGYYAFNTVGSEFDTVLHTRAGCDGGPMACNDDIAYPNVQSALYETLQEGDERIIIVDGYGSSRSGAFVLNIDRSEANACDDGDDNDGDGAIDCEDADCVDADTCEATPMEGTPSETPPPTSTPSRDGDTCEVALDAQGGGVFTGNTAALTNDYNGLGCTGWASHSADQAYVLTLEAGQTLEATLAADWDSSLYLLTDCSADTSECLAGSDNYSSGSPESFTYTAIEGLEVYVIVDGYGTSHSGPYTLSLTVRGSDSTPTPSPTPTLDVDLPGETCENAIPLSGPGSVSGSTVGYASDYSSTGCTSFGSNAPDTVYAITVEAGETLSASVSGSYDAVLWLMADCDAAASECLAGSDVGATGDDEAFSWTAPETMEVFIIVDGWSASTGSYTLTTELETAQTPTPSETPAAPTATFAEPTPTLPPSPTQDPTACAQYDLGSDTGDAVFEGSINPETTDDFQGSCSFGTTGKDLSFLWTAPSDGIWAFDTFDSPALDDSVVYILDGCGRDELACNDDSYVDNQYYLSYVEVSLSEGQTVIVVVDGYTRSVTGAFYLNIHQVGAPTPTEPLFRTLTFEVTVPDPSPGGVYITGDVAELGGWDPDGVTMNPISGDTWRASVEMPTGVSFDYKYTRGTWESVEKYADGNERPNRTGVADSDQTLTDTVERWADDPQITPTPSATPAQPTVAPFDELIISQYVEGSSFNKAVEIYNGTGAAVDLSEYTLYRGTNGAVFNDAYHLLLTGELAHGEVWVIAHTSASAAILAEADQSTSQASWNGNDALALVHGDSEADIVDVLGELGVNANFAVAGEAEATLNHTLVRKASVGGGNTDWANSAGTNADNSEWIVLPNDDISGLGSHSPH